MLDHERYVRNMEERKERQRAYYAEHREEILRKARQRRLDSPKAVSMKVDVRESKRNWYYRNRKAKNPHVFANER